jgi:hypothetical protein
VFTSVSGHSLATELLEKMASTVRAAPRATLIFLVNVVCVALVTGA